MSQPAVQPDGLAASNVLQLESTELRAIREDLDALRRRIVIAWLERGVILTSLERAQLHEDIRETCDFLAELTQAGD